MDLFDKPFRALLEKFSAIEHYQRIVGNNTQKLLSDLADTKKNLEQLDADTQALMGSSINAFYFYSPYDGTAIPYDSKRTSVDEAIQLTFLHKNKQYQWLLAEAYEGYEDCLEHMYASAGYTDIRFWPAKDYDSHEPAQAQAAGLEWFVNQAKRKRGIPASILAQFRRELPSFVTWERQNLLHMDLRLSSVLIEKLRHIIVHKNGRTDQRAKMIEEILKQANHVGDKTLEPRSRAYVSSFFGTDDHDGLVVLVERPVVQRGGVNIAINRVSNLMGEMLAHALIIRNELIQRFSKTQPPVTNSSG